jgi:SAM-dependent methyltransferase
MLQRFPAGAANGLVQASATRLPFADGSFDLTLCLNMLQYLDDGGTSQALAELLRVTRPGGRIILHVKNSASPVGLSRRLSQLVRRAGGKDRVVNETYRSPRWYRSALATEAHLIGGYSYGLHPIGWAPDRWLRRFIMLEEMVRTRLPNHGFGVDCFLKFRVGDAGK